MLNQVQVRNLFEYDPETGVFIHRYDHGRAIAGTEVGWLDEKGYRRTKFRGRTYFLHKLAWLYVHGVYPDELDHWDGNPGNMRINNLRVATRTQNLGNANTAVSASGVRGVHLTSSRNKWRATIRFDKVTYYLGHYDDVSEAHAAYIKAADILYGEFALHNRKTMET